MVFDRRLLETIEKNAQNIPLETTDKTWVLNDTTLKAPKDHKCGIIVASANTGTISF